MPEFDDSSGASASGQPADETPDRTCVGCGTRADSPFCPRCGRELGAHGVSPSKQAGEPLGDVGAEARQPSDVTPHRGRSTKSKAIVGGAAAVALIAAGLAAAAAGGLIGGSKQTITGLVMVNGSFVGQKGGPCQNTEGLSDINAGAQVRVSNGSGELLGVGRLGDGERSETGDSSRFCTFPFSVADVPASDLYEISTGNTERGGVVFTEEEMTQNDWNVVLTLGG